MTKARGDRCKLPFKTTDEDQEEEEATTRLYEMAAAEDISVEKAITAV